MLTIGDLIVRDSFGLTRMYFICNHAKQQNKMKIHKRHQKVILLGGGSPFSVIDLVFRLGVEERELHLVIEKRCYVSDSSSYQVL